VEALDGLYLRALVPAGVAVMVVLAIAALLGAVPLLAVAVAAPLLVALLLPLLLAPGAARAAAEAARMQGRLRAAVAKARSDGDISPFEQDLLLLAGGARVPQSRLFVYWNGRALAGMPPDRDEGLAIRDAMRSVAKFNSVPESAWPFDPVPQRVFLQPTADVVALAALPDAFRYERVPQDEASVKSALAQRRPVVLGIHLLDSFFRDVNRQREVRPYPILHEADIIRSVGTTVPQQHTIRPRSRSVVADKGTYSLERVH
jgi:hypothetical protein